MLCINNYPPAHIDDCLNEVDEAFFAEIENKYSLVDEVIGIMA